MLVSYLGLKGPRGNFFRFNMKIGSNLILLLASIKAGSKGRKKYVRAPLTSANISVARRLYEAGFLSYFAITRSPKPTMQIGLKYTPSGYPVLGAIKAASRPSRPLFLNHTEIARRLLSKKSRFLVVTTRGLRWEHEANKLGVGGEVVCFID